MITLLRLSEVQRRLVPMNLRHVARETGIEYGTLYRVANGAGNTSYTVVEKLSDWLVAANDG